MAENAGYELSASYINGLVRSVREAGFLDAILPTLQPDLRNAYLRPALQPWWDARFAEQLAFAVGEQFGERAVEQVGYGVVAEAIGPLAAPELNKLLATSGAGPAMLFSQLEQFIKLAVRPVTPSWSPKDANSGRLEIGYPVQTRQEILVLWRGAIRYAFEVTKSTGKIEQEQQGPRPGQLVFDVSWVPQAQ